MVRKRKKTKPTKSFVNFKTIYKDWLSFLTFSLILGISLLSIGVYLVGIHLPNGNLVLILGSFIVYISVIVLAFKV
jgi:hypothetical protein